MFAALVCMLAGSLPHVDVLSTQVQPPIDLPRLAWVGEHPENAFDGPPLAVIGDPNAVPTGRLWGAIDANALRLHIEVRDPSHVNNQEGTQIWDGDSIQLSVDARGHREAGLARDADFVSIGDLYAAFALTRSGPQGWAHLRGAPDAPGALPTPTRIVRDDERGLTIYDIVLPWTDLHTLPGAFPTIGLGIQINDATAGKATQAHAHWGGGVSGTLRPGLLNVLAYDPPPEGYADIMVSRADMWRPDDAPEMIAVHHSKSPLQLESMWQGNVETLIVSSNEPTRTVLRAVGGLWSTAAQSWRVRARGDIQKEVSTSVSTPPLAFQVVDERLETLLDGSQDSLVRQHVRNVGAVLRQAWEAGSTLLPDNPQSAYDALQTAQHLLPTLAQDSQDPNLFRHGARAWVGSFISPDDGSFQPYTVRLPRTWDPNKAHPLVVFLHGKGDPQVTHFVDNAVTGTGRTEDDAIVLAPWGRGIYGYRGLPESDVLVALQRVQATFKVDPDRVYLAGFSMGGAGAWSIALHAPAPWAAVSISSGGTWLTSLGIGLGGNVHDLPLQIWHGDADGAVDVSEAHLMRKELEHHGAHPQFTIAHGAGHVFNDARWHDMVAWLLQHKRQPTSGFSYVCDDFIHRGRNGIKMRRDTAQAAFPRVKCKVTGNQVRLESLGTPGLDVDLGPEGLGLQGDVTLHWNGKKIYSGPPTVVTLGIGGGTR